MFNVNVNCSCQPWTTPIPQSHELISAVVGHVLRDHAGYNVQLVTNATVLGATSEWDKLIQADAFDVDAENWQAGLTPQRMKEMEAAGLGEFPRSGVIGRVRLYYMGPQYENLGGFPSYFAYWRSATAVLPAFNDTPVTDASGAATNACSHEWCTTPYSYVPASCTGAQVCGEGRMRLRCVLVGTHKKGTKT